MGVGKTTVGQALRRAPRPRRSSTPTSSSWPAAGMPCRRACSAMQGEAGVPRSWSVTPSPTPAASPTPLVIACGGGAVLDPDNRGALRGTRRRRVARAAPRRARSRGSAPRRRRRAAARGGRARGHDARAARRRCASPRTRPPRTCTVDDRRPDRRRGRRDASWRSSARGTGDRRAPRRRLRRRRRRRRARRRGRAARRPPYASRWSASPASPTSTRPRSLPRCSSAGVDHRPVPDRRRRGRQVARHRRRPVLGASPSGGSCATTRRRARRGSGGRHRRVRGGGVPPRRRRRAGAHHAARAGRRRDRRQDRGQPARGQEPRRRVPPAARGATPTSPRSPRCRRASTASGLGEVAKYALMPGGERVRDDRRAARPTRSSRATSTCSPSSSPRARR